MQKDGISISGALVIEVKGADGAIKDTRTIPNLIVDTGLGYIASRMVNATSVMTHMALGSGTILPAAGDSALGAQLGDRVALTSADAAGATVTYTAAFSAGVATGAVTEAGIFSAGTGGVMLCRTMFPVVNKEAGDTMSITWTITLTAQ